MWALSAKHARTVPMAAISALLLHYESASEFVITLKASNKNCSRRHFNLLLLPFEEKRLDFSCESSA